jgi:S1-C subfamily serine protease
VTNSERAYLGIGTGATSGGEGVLVLQVAPGGPAAQAGIQVGSLITSVAGKPTPTPTDLAEVLATLKPGQTVPVTVVPPNSSTKTTVNVTLGELPG